MEENEAEIIHDAEIENYAEVLSLTEWDSGGASNDNSNSIQINAEYLPIEITEISKNTRIKTKSFVNKVTKFILDLNGDGISDETKAYLKDVAEIQVNNISDLSYILHTNKQLLDNILRRINATQADDFVTINLYSTLVTQHLKLSKELNTAYKDLPSVMKRMKAEVESDREFLGEIDSEKNQLITESFGETQFNSQKQLLEALRNQSVEKNQVFNA
jgi:hypothetical protein